MQPESLTANDGDNTKKILTKPREKNTCQIFGCSFSASFL